MRSLRKLVRRPWFGLTLGVALALASATLFGGCFVSFDGYELATDHDASVTTGGTSGAAGASAGNAGVGISGAAGNAGSGTSGAGTSGSAGSGGGGMSGAGSSGVSGAGNAGVSGSSGASGASGSAGASGSSGTGGASGSAGASGSSGTGGAVNCPDTGFGAVLIDVPKPGGGIYCIDRNEVTNFDYSLFLATNPNVSDQTSECSWNMNFAPETSSAALGACAITNYALGGMSKLPVDCIDWCDAKKFCEYAKKHLCGAIGGGAIASSAFADASQDAWYAACSQGGIQQFPYGTSWMSGACQDTSGSGTRATSVPTSSCEGGYASIFDMVGNVAEWEDSCVTNSGVATDQCLVRGGGYLSYNTKFPAATCSSSPVGASSPQPATRSRQTRAEDVGFRCCLDP